MLIHIFYCVVIDYIWIVFAGEPIIVSADERVVIDCGPQIDSVAAETDMTPIVRWYKDGTIITTGSPINVHISDDGRFCVITETVSGAYSKFCSCYMATVVCMVNGCGLGIVTHHGN